MKLPLIAACMIAGSTWSFATAGDTASINPKTASKPFAAPTQLPGKMGKPVYTTKTAPPQFSSMLSAIAPANPSLLPAIVASGNADDCSAAKAITGAGPFAFDNTAATTGPQQGLGCGTGTCNNDVWFQWTANASGTCIFTLCGGGAAHDTLIAVYSGAGCPGGGALICNDDSCGLISQVSFPVTAGSVYMLQIGSYSAAGFGTGTFTMTIPPPVTNDDCTSPITWTGTGSFPFNQLGATTGVQGQANANCLFFGSTTIDNDVWYTWTAPASGCTIIDTCGSTVDTKIAVYQGSGCPSGSSIACNDDSCGLQSKVSFQATSGQTYTIQLGTFPGALGGTGSANIAQIPAGSGQDDCSTPNILTGVGTFAFDNTLATTGCEGQGEALCAVQYGQVTVDNDIWFQWTAPTTGIALMDTCLLTTVDTKIAAYAGAGCPTNGSALACNDDACVGFQSTMTWNVTAGSTYTIQLGTFPGATGGPGSFSLNVLLPPTNDDCSTPIALGPTGPYAFSQLGATTGVQGQAEPLCLFFGSTTIDNDIWYTWTAPSSGRAQVTLCGLSTVDSKVAIYAGAGCPSGSAVACNDDSCGLQSEICFPVTAGQTYTIQLGTFPGALAGTGSFDIITLPALPPCTYDDGSTENLLTWFAGGDMVWLNKFGSVGGNTTLSSVDVAWGSALFAGFNPGNGTPTDIFVWQDGATQDGDPSDATLLLQIPTTVSNVDTDTFVTYTFAPLNISGIFFVGSHQDNYGLSGAGPTQYVAPMDQNCTTANVAWFFGNNSGFGTSPVTYSAPASNLQPPATFDSIGLPCQVLVRAGCNAGPATYLCDPGVGGVIACPCANPPSGSGKGCDNSSATGGASISGSGSASVSASTLVFTTAGERPTATSIVLQGTASLPGGVAFGQGVRCTGGILKRLYTKGAVGGSITAPAGADPDVATRSASLGDPITAGQNRYYMVYYRDPIVLGGCQALATFNSTPTAQVTWQP